MTSRSPIFEVVLKRITVRGSIVGTRKDLEEAFDFTAEGKVHAHIHPGRLEDINAVFERIATIEQPEVWTFGVGTVRHPGCAS